MQYRSFGKTGKSVPILGFGTMRLPMKEGRIDEEESIRIIRYAIDRGMTYVDTAYRYHEGESELLVAKALADGYREKVFLADKAPVWLMESAADFDRILDEQLQKCNTDHFDFYMLHSVSARTFRERVQAFGLIDKMKEAKAAGKINAIGFSFHDDYRVFEEILDCTDAWDFCQIQLNYAGVDYQAGLRGLYRAAERGLAVIVMEPLLGGKLANLTPAMAEKISPARPPVQWALDWVWNLPEVSILLSGMGTFEQVQQNLDYADQTGAGILGEADLAMLDGVYQTYLAENQIPCTNCGYCMPCPHGLEINQRAPLLLYQSGLEK